MDQHKKSICDQIIEHLSSGPVDKLKLRGYITDGRTYTSQGFYKALEQLRAKEVITIHKGVVSLTFFWVQAEADRISRIVATYRMPVFQSYFGALKDGESISYRYRTLREMQVFWTHAIFISVENASKNSHIISLTPHDWYQNLRPDINAWWKRVTTGHPHWAVLTHASVQEMRTTHYPEVKDFERMAAVNPLRQKESTYINIVEDLIFEARFDERIIPEIRHFMDGTEPSADKILDMQGTFRLTIERNAKRAKKVENKLKKYFSVSLNSTVS